jgi:hypothetical protein
MRFRTAAGAVAALVLLLAPPAAVAQTPAYWEQIGYNDLRIRLGAATPTGAGIVVSQIEAQEAPNAYLPDPGAFTGKTIIDKTGGGLPSGHATSVGQFLYGNQSITPGISTVNAYRIASSSLSGDWLGGGYLNAGTPLPPFTDGARVQNHSYVDTASSPNDPGVAQILRRLDFAIARDNVVAVVAVNNGTGPIPALQAHGYNSIAVGLSNGNSSVGPTVGEGAGRSKPDLVVPSDLTSFGTPVVSAAAALLVQTAAGHPDAVAAGRVETIKATLLTGATTTGLAWQRTNNGTFVEPLDRRFGAGQLNVNNSHLILTSPKQNGADQLPDARTGWDFTTLTGVGDTRRYYIDAPADVPGASLAVTVTWLRRVTQTGPNFSASLANLQLRLYETDANLNLGAVVDSSLSPVDNVEHLRSNLALGQRYALEVTLADLPAGQASENYAIAWQVSPVPEPGGMLLIAALLGGVMRWRRMR